MNIRIESATHADTVHFGRLLAAMLKPGMVIALIGDLGSGKTWFTKGVALGLGVDPNMVVTSPSFALVNEYEGRHLLYHMDFYRLEELTDVTGAGLDEYMCENGVAVIEWGDRWPEILPEQSIKVNISIIDEQRREVILSGPHPHAVEILELIEQEVSTG